jgi:integrase
MGSIQEYPKGSGRYCVVVYWHGKHERFWQHPDVPDVKKMSRELALSLLSMIRIDLKRQQEGWNPDNYRPEAPISLGVFSEKWLSLSAACKNTKKVYRHGINLTIAKFGANFNIRNFHHSSLLEFQNELKEKYSGDTVYKVLSGLKTMLRFYQADNPAFILPKFPELSQPVREEVDWLTYDEQQKVLAAIPERHRGIFIIMMEYGLRPQEATALKWDCVSDGFITFRRSHSEYTLRETTKTGAIRVEKITTRAAIAIKQAGQMPQSKKGWVFYHNERGSHYDNKILNRIWKAACEGCGHRAIGLYESVRHSLGHQLAEAGYGLDFIQDVYKHTNLRTTRRYAKRDRGQIADALEQRGQVVEFKRKRRGND